MDSGVAAGASISLIESCSSSPYVLPGDYELCALLDQSTGAPGVFAGDFSGHGKGGNSDTSAPRQEENLVCESRVFLGINHIDSRTKDGNSFAFGRSGAPVSSGVDSSRTGR